MKTYMEPQPKGREILWANHATHASSPLLGEQRDQSILEGLREHAQPLGFWRRRDIVGEERPFLERPGDVVI